MDAKLIQKYRKKSLPQLIKKAEEVFNAYIRKRDMGSPCISCGKYGYGKQAGHFYSAGHYPELRFNEDNVHGQCVRCNMHLHGNLNEYRKGLERRIGKERVEMLDRITAIVKQTGYKWDRFFLIDIIEKYK